MEQKLISVIIPTYNSFLYIKESLDSAINQTYKNIEAIIIDDGSTDNTKELLKEYADQKKIIYIKKENGGPASARNLGIKKSTGKYIALLDADDIWSKDKLEKQIDLLEKNDLDLVHTGRFFISKENIKEWIAHPRQNTNDLIRKNFIITSSVLAKAEILKENIFNEGKQMFAVEDYDLWLRLAFRNYKFGYLEEKLTGYRIHPNQISSPGNINNLIRVYKKNISYTKNHLYKLLLLYMYVRMNLYRFKIKTKII